GPAGRVVEVVHPLGRDAVGGEQLAGAAALGTARVVPDDHAGIGHGHHGTGYPRWPQAATVSWDRKEKSGSWHAAIAAASTGRSRPRAVISGASCSKVSCQAAAPADAPGQIVARASVPRLARPAAVKSASNWRPYPGSNPRSRKT